MAEDPLDALIAASAQRVLDPPPAHPAAYDSADPLDSLIARSAKSVLGPDFSSVQSLASSTAPVTGLPDQAAPPAPASLDAGFRQWYQNYVKQTGATLSYDQARQLYKSLPPEERSARSPAPSTGEIIERVQNAWGMPSPAQAVDAASLYGRNVLSGMKGGADFLAHLPGIPFTAIADRELAAREQERQNAVSEAVIPELMQGRMPDESAARYLNQAHPPTPERGPALPQAVEDTFQSSRDERERLADETAKKLTEAGASPALAAAAYAVPQTVGNLLDPTMLLAPAEVGKLAQGLDGLIARSAERVLGKRAAEAGAERGASILGEATPEELAYLARREKAMPTIPGAEEPFVGPGAVREGLRPEGSILQIGQHADRAAQDVALGLRAAPADAAELARASLPIAETEQTAERAALEEAAARQPRGVPDANQAPGPSGQAPYDAPVLPPGPDAEQVGRPPALAGRQEGEVVAPGYRSPEDSLDLRTEGPGLPDRGEPGQPSGGPGPLAEGDRPAAATEPADPLTTAEAIEPGSTGIKNAAVEAERPLRGLPPEVDHEGRRAVGDAWDAAKAEIEADPARPRRLAEELKASKRPHTAEESAVLTIGRQQLYDERKTVIEAAENALKAGDEEGLASAKARLASIDADLEANDLASARSGYEWGLAGRLRQMMVREDYSSYRVLQKARVAAEAPELPKAVEERLTGLSSRIEETSKALEAARGQLDELSARRAVKTMEREAAYEVRTAQRKVVKQDLDQEFSALSSEFGKKAATPRMGIDPDLAKLIAKMAKNRVKAGVTTVEQLVDTIYQVARTHMPEITPRQVRDAISGYGAEAKTSKRQTTSALADANRQLRLLSALEDAKAGRAPAKRAGGPAPAPSPRVRELERQVREEMRRQGLDSQARLSAYEGRLKSRKADLERRLAEKDFAKPGPRAPVSSPEVQALQVDLGRLKGKIDAEVKKLEMANRSPFEKGLDVFVKWRRAVLLSSAATMEKLGAAAGLRTFVTTPIEQLIGGAYAKVPGLSAIAAKAPREGAMSLAAEAKAFATVFSKETYKDAWQAVKTGKTSLDVLYGKKGDFPPEVLDFFGHLHAGMKTLPKKAEFNRSLELRYAFARKKGWDLTSPVIQAEIASQAYADAQRAILLQDNVFTDGYRIALNFLKGKNARGTAAVLETLFPIIKVPTNYVSEALEYGLGPARALNKLIWSGGIQGLDARGADYVMRNLKKGTVGSTLLALGYYNADKIGGYYQRNEKRDPEDVHVSDVRISLFGKEFDIPHQLLHAPALEMLQMGATLRRVKERYEDRDKPHGMAAGIQAAERGLAEQVPFYEELMSVGRANESLASWQKYAGNLGRSLVIPPDVQNFARVQDQEESPWPWAGTAQMMKLSHPDTIKRYPGNLWEEMKVGIPWARESVPDSK